MEKRLHKRIKRWIRYWLLRFIFFCMGTLPLRLAKKFGAILGEIGFLLAKKERHKSLASLAQAFPEKSEEQRLEIARQSFRHLGICGAELCCLKQIDSRISDYVELNSEDQNLLENALAENKGVVFVSGHVGNFELLARRIALGGYPCQTIAKEASDPRLTKLIEKVRASGKLRSIWRGQNGAARQMLRALHQGEILGLLIDQDTKVQGLFVDFFGKKAFTPRAAADLALRTRAAVITGFAFRREDGGHRIKLTRLPLSESDNREQDALQVTQDLTQAIENAIRQTPHGWVWMHQRWKTRPS